MEMNEAYELEAIYQRNTLEWFALRAKFDQDVKYKSGKELLDWKREEIKQLIDLLKAHKRDLDYRAGEHKPETQFAEVDMRGEFGGMA